MTGYLVLIAFATLFDLVLSNEQNKVRRIDKLIRAFSIPRNWNRLKTIKSTPELERLRVIQGLRFYNTITVILTHTVMLIFMLPISNTEMTEGVSITIFVSLKCKKLILSGLSFQNKQPDITFKMHLKDKNGVSFDSSSERSLSFLILSHLLF